MSKATWYGGEHFPWQKRVLVKVSQQCSTTIDLRTYLETLYCPIYVNKDTSQFSRRQRIALKL